MSVFDIGEYYDENMNPIDTNGIITTFIDIPSTNFENEWIGGDYGIPPIFSGATVQQKQIEITIELIACDYLDYQLLRDELYGMFGFNKPFFVVDKRQRGKRHKVVLDANFMPIRHNPINGTAVIPFITCEPHFSESIVTTMDIERYGVPNVGMGLDPNESYIYEYRLMSERAFDEQFILPWQTIPAESLGNTSFSIYNAGIPIHPFEQRLKITIKNAIGSDEYIELKNITNGTTFRLNEGLGDKELVIDRGQVTLNGLQSLRQTNKEFIELDHGWNQFEISGMDIVTVQFDFNFYYL